MSLIPMILGNVIGIVPCKFTYPKNTWYFKEFENALQIRKVLIKQVQVFFQNLTKILKLLLCELFVFATTEFIVSSSISAYYPREIFLNGQWINVRFGCERSESCPLFTIKRISDWVIIYNRSSTITIISYVAKFTYFTYLGI